MENISILSTFDVTDLSLKDGSVYSGQAARTTVGIVPHGMGIAKYADHNVLGKYSFGEQKGPAYINYHDWMWAGDSTNNELHGWGIYIDRGECHYGYFLNGKMKVDLTPLVRIIWHRILDMSKSYNFKMIRVLKNKEEVFIGYPEIALYGKMGFHFTDGSYDYIGVHEYGHADDFTGTFLRIDKLWGTMMFGIFSDGKILKDIDRTEFATAAELWVTHEFLDFNICGSFNPGNYNIYGYHFYKIFELGNIPGYTIAKAYTCIAYKDHFEVTKNVQWFKFAQDDDIIEELQRISQEEHPWVPDTNYCIEFINNIREAGTSHLPVHRHISCDDNSGYYELDIYDDVDFSKVEVVDESNTDLDLPF